MPLLQLNASLRQDQEPASFGGDSVFPRVDELLSNTKNQRALKHVGLGYNKSCGYRSVVDALLCKVLPQYRESCIAFYKDNGKPLRALKKLEELERIEQVLLSALEIASTLATASQEINWLVFRNRVLKTQKNLGNPEVANLTVFS